MAQLGEGDSHGTGFLGSEEDTASFGFSGRADDIFDSIAEDMEGGIEHRCRGGGGILTEDEPCRSSGAGFGEDKVGGVGFKLQNHIAGMVSEGGIRMTV